MAQPPADMFRNSSKQPVLDRQIFNEAMAARPMPAHALRVGIAIVSLFNPKRGHAFLSLRKIGEMLTLDRTVVVRAVAFLEADSWFFITRGRSGRGKACTSLFVPNVQKVLSATPLTPNGASQSASTSVVDAGFQGRPRGDTMSPLEVTPAHLKTLPRGDKSGQNTPPRGDTMSPYPLSLPVEGSTRCARAREEGFSADALKATNHQPETRANQVAWHHTKEEQKIDGAIVAAANEFLSHGDLMPHQMAEAKHHHDACLKVATKYHRNHHLGMEAGDLVRALNFAMSAAAA